MAIATDIPKYEYHSGNRHLIFDSIEYEVGTKISDYEVLTNGLHSAINGRIPRKITLKGKFLRDDFDDISNYFYSKTGSIIYDCTIHDRLYSALVLIDAKAVLGEAEHTGDMTMVLREVLNG